jgi:hypothetical protein
MTMLRTRWAAIGAAVAVTLGAGGIGLGHAAQSSDARPVYVALAAPCRVVDTRSGSPIGAGDANALTVQITGENGDCTDDLAIPADATAVATNVTVIQPNGAASGRSYFTVYPADADRPTTSNLNFVNGQAPTPNKVDVGLSADGRITIFNNEGTAHAAVDVFGYYIDHHHDDRYYTKTQVYTKAELDGPLQTLNAAIGTKANVTNVYTRAEIDARTAVSAVTVADTPTVQFTKLDVLGNIQDNALVASVTITPPGPGRVIVNWSMVIYDSLLNEGARIGCLVTPATQAQFATTGQRVTIQSLGANFFDHPLAGTTSRTATPGVPMTLNLVCAGLGEVMDNTSFRNVEITAVFSPTP